MASKMTAGERIVCRVGNCTLRDLRDSASQYAQDDRDLAAMIDRAIARAVKAERAKWQTSQTFAPKSKVVKLKRGKR